MGGSLSKRVVKTMGIFGGVQMVNILCSIVRTKIVALWVGTAGIGLFGVFNSAMEFVSTLAQMGLGTAGTRDVAVAKGAERHRAVVTVRLLSVVLGLAGTLLMLVGAPLLSLWSFGNTAHAGAFRLLSPSILFLTVASAEVAVLQGVERLKAVAGARLWGAVGLVASAVPLIWFWRLQGIVPVLVAGSASLMAGTFAHRYRLPERTRLAWRELSASAKGLLRLGFFITVSDMLTFAASYVLMAYLNSVHSSEIAGLYQSGFTMINRYVGLVFTAIIVEYYPRISSVVTRRRVTEVFVSHELRTVLLVIVPAMCLFVPASPWVVELLYSRSFLEVTPMVEIGAVGTLFRAVSWCMAVVMLARGDGRVYMVTESLSAVFYVVLNVLTVNSLGIPGMGWAYAAWYGLYMLIVGVVFFRGYGLRLCRGMWAFLGCSLLTVTAVTAVTMCVDRFVGLALGLIVTAFVARKALRRRRRG